MKRLTVGDNLDKNMDVGPLSNPAAIIRLGQLVTEAQAEGAQVSNDEVFCQISLIIINLKWNGI